MSEPKSFRKEPFWKQGAWTVIASVLVMTTVYTFIDALTGVGETVITTSVDGKPVSMLVFRDGGLVGVTPYSVRLSGNHRFRVKPLEDLATEPKEQEFFAPARYVCGDIYHLEFSSIP